MTRYLVSIYHPDNYDPSGETEAMSCDIDALNEEMVAAGVRVFVGGLSSASNARVLITDGPYIDTKEHIGGFWVLEAADLDQALAWGCKAAVACVGHRSRSASSTDRAAREGQEPRVRTFQLTTQPTIRVVLHDLRCVWQSRVPVRPVKLFHAAVLGPAAPS